MSEKVDVNKSYIFKTDLSKSINLVRTGTISDGNCFIHSVFHALNRDDYKYKSNEEKQSMVNTFRDTMVNSMTFDKFKRLNQGEISRMLIQQQIHDNLESVLKFFHESTEPESLSSVQSIILKDISSDKDVMTTLKMDVFSKKVLPRSFKKTSQIERYSNYILGYLNQYVNIENKNLVKVSKLVQSVVNHSISESFDIFTSKLKQGSYVDDFTLDFVSDELKVNVFVIDFENRLPYRREYNDKYDDSVVVLWINKNHFEVLGELTSVQESTIERVFPKDHSFIVNIREYLSTK